MSIPNVEGVITSSGDKGQHQLRKRLPKPVQRYGVDEQNIRIDTAEDESEEVSLDRGNEDPDYSESKKKAAENCKDPSRKKPQKTQLWKDVKKLEEENSTLRVKLQAEKQGYEEKLKEKEMMFDAAQNVMTKIVEKNETFKIPDDRVRDKLSCIRSEWRVWAKERCVESFQMCPEIAIRDAIQKGVRKNDLEGLDKIYDVLRKKKSGPAICLNTVLAFDICEKTFNQPFLSFHSEHDGNEVKKICEQFLRRVENVDKRKACAWRAQTLQLLDYEQTDGHQIRGQEEGSPREKLEKHYMQLAVSFIETHRATLLRDAHQEELNKICEEVAVFYREAGNYSIELSMQKTQMAIDTSSVLKQKFSMRSQLMRPHVSMLLEEDDKTFDRRKPDMVVEPALVAFGDADGQNYHMRKIWMEATVLIIEENGDITNEDEHSADALAPIKNFADSENDPQPEGSLKEHGADAEPPSKRPKLSKETSSTEETAKTGLHVEVKSDPVLPQKTNSGVKKDQKSPKIEQEEPPSTPQIQKKPPMKGKSSQNSFINDVSLPTAIQAKKRGKARLQQKSQTTRNSFNNDQSMRTVMGNQFNVKEMVDLNSLLRAASQTQDTVDLRKQQEHGRAVHRTEGETDPGARAGGAEANFKPAKETDTSLGGSQQNRGSSASRHVDLTNSE